MPGLRLDNSMLCASHGRDLPQACHITNGKADVISAEVQEPGSVISSANLLVAACRLYLPEV